MKHRGGYAAMGRWAVMVVAVLSGMVFLVPRAQAADEIAGRNVGHAETVELVEVGDVPGHFLGVSRNYGMSFYTKGPDQGEIIPRVWTATFDVVKGKGTFSGYEVKTFKDGSTIVVKASGTQAPTDEGKRTAFKGTWEVVSGTGRFAGTKGTGTFQGERIGDPKTGGDNYSDFAGTITK